MIIERLRDRKEQGITLIALVVTIIVLIILAGVSLSLVIGDNGLMLQAENAKEANLIGNYQEQIELARSDIQANHMGIVTLDNWIDRIYEKGVVPQGNIIKKDEQNAVVITQEGYQFLITVDKETEYMGNTDTNVKIEDLKPGDYVQYNVPSKQFTIAATDTGYTEDQSFDTTNATNLWQILYNREGELEITSFKSVANLKLNRSWTESNFNHSVALSNSRIAYNNAITVLNAMCQNYINEEYATAARVIGSNPSNPVDGITTYVTTVKGSNSKVTNPGVKIGDNYYQEDYNAMQAATSQNSAGILNINENYFLGSRGISYETRGVSDYLPGIGTEDESYCIRNITQTGELGITQILGNTTGAGTNWFLWHTIADMGVRPVIKLKADLSVLTGSGTQDDPYILR